MATKPKQPKGDAGAAKAKKSTAKPRTKRASAPKAAAKPKITVEMTDELEAVLKRYRGRPTKYDPAMCDAVIAWGILGKSKTWMAAEMMVVRETLDDWGKANPEFSDALRVAKQLEQAYWEDKGEKFITTTGFAQNCWGRNMAARFPKEWRESKELTGANGTPLIPVMNMLYTDGRTQAETADAG